jgi:hypothetical protein
MTDRNANPVQAAYEHNGRSVSPQAFYAMACDPRRTVAVEACAGAGKTWMLVSRIVRALLDGVDPQTGQLTVQPHEILAITFTKRAASEMRERLYQWLQEFSVAAADARLQALRDRGVTLPSDPVAQIALTTRLAALCQLAGQRTAGANSHLPQLVCSPAAQRSAEPLAATATACQLRTAGGRCHRQGLGVAPFLCRIAGC